MCASEGFSKLLELSLLFLKQTIFYNLFGNSTMITWSIHQYVGYPYFQVSIVFHCKNVDYPFHMDIPGCWLYCIDN